jgi:hypothetical protein
MPPVRKGNAVMTAESPGHNNLNLKRDLRKSQVFAGLTNAYEHNRIDVLLIQYYLSRSIYFQQPDTDPE